MVTTPVVNLTFEEYLTYDDGSGFHYELVNSRLELINIRTIEHFLIEKFLKHLVDIEITRLSLPWLSFQKTGVRTGKNKSRLTDLCVVTQEQARELLKVSAVFETLALLIVEVVSPDIADVSRIGDNCRASFECGEAWLRCL
ncbi:hypothetical protein NOS3756_28680 [Nostoc sp. NIES-3756]|uniref:Uma2 family endonuclease n=1 Tax=Nostoc sp. NIES-3756 TaxID=1751286 RepID=UPI00071EF17F|nr:Uma2 family endonuclease [Nostoc sp. NIES-3756]BAT53905.1 hypothetical protein NOS3756_28680 [Nostoc sp. NIES-3756]